MKDPFEETLEVDLNIDPFGTLKTSVTAVVKDLPDGIDLEDLDRVHVALLCEILSEEE